MRITIYSTRDTQVYNSFYKVFALVQIYSYLMIFCAKLFEINFCANFSPVAKKNVMAKYIICIQYTHSD